MSVGDADAALIWGQASRNRRTVRPFEGVVNGRRLELGDVNVRDQLINVQPQYVELVDRQALDPAVADGKGTDDDPSDRHAAMESAPTEANARALATRAKVSWEPAVG